MKFILSFFGKRSKINHPQYEEMFYIQTQTADMRFATERINEVPTDNQRSDEVPTEITEPAVPPVIKSELV